LTREKGGAARSMKKGNQDKTPIRKSTKISRKGQTRLSLTNRGQPKMSGGFARKAWRGGRGRRPFGGRSISASEGFPRGREKSWRKKKNGPKRDFPQGVRKSLRPNK